MSQRPGSRGTPMKRRNEFMVGREPRDAALVGRRAADRTSAVDRGAAGEEGEGVGGAAVVGERTEEGVRARQVASLAERTGAIAGEVVA